MKHNPGFICTAILAAAFAGCSDSSAPTATQPSGEAATDSPATGNSAQPAAQDEQSNGLAFDAAAAGLDQLPQMDADDVLPARRPGQLRYHTVERGETLSKIASKTGCSIEKLVELNSLTDVNMIYPGQLIYVPDHVKE